MPRHTLIAGNWKMNGNSNNLPFFHELASLITPNSTTEVLVCPPVTLLASAAEACEDLVIQVGGQDCHIAEGGAHTGDIAVSMLKDAGATHVIVGHSERRADHAESDATVRGKAEAVLAQGLIPIICIGETLADREAGHAERVVGAQLAGSLPEEGAEIIVIAYEPVWAIGTGLTASLDDIAAMHAFIRTQLAKPEQTQILYGGSVKPGNAAEILSLTDVDGALVGGASLTTESFSRIVNAA
jgi:triosephosphate isomerase